MVTFYPGPSQLYPEIDGYLSDAFREGILSVNHRSESFMNLLRSTLDEMKNKLDIPPAYEIYFTSSATECWEIVAQSLVSRRSFHLYNGAFGQKWHEYTRLLKPEANGISFGMNDAPHLPGSVSDYEILCLTHSETSNGTVLSEESLAGLRQHFDGLIALDATSSMAGMSLPWLLGDVWFASAQKCFGMPSGLGILIVSPAAIRHAEKIAERSHYNSLLFIRDNFLKYQTPYTPNTLGIYLMGRVMKQVEPIAVVSKIISDRALGLYRFLEKEGYELLVDNESVRSNTVLAVKYATGQLAELKARLKLHEITIGNGYGEWKENTFRIANFPAISAQHIEKLKTVLAMKQDDFFEEKTNNQ